MRARRRHLANLLLAQGAVALSAGCAGVLLLLIVGTQILDWQWPVLLCLAVFAVGVFRVRRARVPLYRTAQTLDNSLGLQDRLSTAYYFRHLAPKAPELVDTVENQAIDRVQQGDVERAVPLRFPTAGYLAAALAVAAVSLFAVRYGVLKTLSLERPLARINFDTFSAPPKVEAASTRKSVVQEHLEKQLQQLGLSLEEMQQPMEKSGEKPNATNVTAVSDEPGGTQKGPPGQNASDPTEGSEENKGDDQPSGPQATESKEQGSGQPSAGQKGQPSTTPPKAAPKPGGNNPGVIDKMKDALANLLNKLGNNQQGEKGQETASNQSQQQGGAKQQQSSEKGTQGQGKAQGDNQPSPDSQGKDSEGGEQTPGQQQRASQQEGAKGASENSKNGMGKSDGDKSIRDAEQLAAMGKISEIFGKRAAEMKGEMSVEVPSGKQQLRTAYSNSSATHAGAVAEANRNEIPLVYQPYVQRYFEEVRKAAASAAVKTQPAPAKN
jgi:hypothetical protein